MGVCDHNNNNNIIMVTHTTLHTCVPHYTHNVCDVVCNNNIRQHGSAVYVGMVVVVCML